MNDRLLYEAATAHLPNPVPLRLLTQRALALKRAAKLKRRMKSRRKDKIGTTKLSRRLANQGPWG